MIPDEIAAKTSIFITIETTDPSIRARAIELVDQVSQLGIEVSLSITPVITESEQP